MTAYNTIDRISSELSAFKRTFRFAESFEKSVQLFGECFHPMDEFQWVRFRIHCSIFLFVSNELQFVADDEKWNGK